MSEINLTNQDCFELFKIIKNKSIDLVLTDPPFGMAFKSNHRKVKHDKILNDDNLDWLPFWVEEIKRIIKDDAHLYIFCSNHFVDIFVSEVKKHLPYKNILIWEKNNTGMGDLEGDYAPQYEFIIFCSNSSKKLKGRRDSNIIKAKKTGNIYHPTQKPINLMEYFIEKSSNINDLVLDCFSGSGTTAIACHNTKRNFIGCELNKEYYDKSILRINNYKSQLTMF